MDIVYENGVEHSYILIEKPEGTVQYECSMLIQNRIPGMLMTSLRHIDDKVYYVYERTGLKALSDIMSGRMFNGEELLNLFENIRELLRKMDEYLISPEALYLSEKAVFIDEKNFRPQFCLIPGKTVKVKVEIKGLLEYMLGHVDYRDQSAVSMSYQMFSRAGEDNTCIDDILSIAENIYSKEIQWEKINAAVPEVLPSKLDDMGYRAVNGVKNPVSSVYEDKTSHAIVPYVQKKTVTVGRTFLRRLLERIFGNNSKAENDNYKSDVSGYLIPASANAKYSVAIKNTPFYIGKSRKNISLCLKNDNISRYHAKLIIDNGKFILYDLYSANGTFVNGKRILPENGASISFGDEIAFADINFRLVSEMT